MSGPTHPLFGIFLTVRVEAGTVDSNAITVGIDTTDAQGDLKLRSFTSPVHVRGILLGYYTAMPQSPCSPASCWASC